MRKIKFAEGQYYHIFNRGVDKRHLFENGSDFSRFYESLYIFNDANYSNRNNHYLHNETLLAGAEILQIDRDPLVSIVSFCLLPNHFHLLLLQRKENGVARFLHKLGLGYTGYFNRKYDRSGRLFESTYKAAPIKTDAHFLHLTRYIHLNAIDHTHPGWREGKIKDWRNAQKSLDRYPWSSHPIYRGESQELPVIYEAEVHQLFPNPKSYSMFLNDWATRALPNTLFLDVVT